MKFEKTLFILITLVVAVGYYLAITDPHYFEKVYTREDGFFEWMTAVALFAGSLLMASRVIRLRQSKSRLFLFITAMAAATFLFGAGEEISWGQRVFGIETPQSIKEMNAQGELNIHNLRIKGVKLNKLIFSQLLTLFLVLYLLVLPWLYHKKEGVRRWADSWAIPIATKQQILFYLFIAIAVSLIPQNRRWELMEFSGSLVFLMILISPKNKEIYCGHS